MTETYLADTYALIEIAGGNRNYIQYEDSNIMTTKFALAELFHYFLKNFGSNLANLYLVRGWQLLTQVTMDAIKLGMAFKISHKSENLSYADCIGYGVACQLGIRFLTGDEKFRNKENVEFVK